MAIRNFFGDFIRLVSGSRSRREEKDIYERERSCLVTIYEECNGKKWATKNFWNSDRPLSFWDKVKVLDGFIVRLELTSNNLLGTFPNIFVLDKLTELYLSENRLTGTINWEMFSAYTPSLHLLHIDGNCFEGSVDWAALMKLDRLTSLMIGTNNFSGAYFTSSLVTKSLIMRSCAQYFIIRKLSRQKYSCPDA